MERGEERVVAEGVGVPGVDEAGVEGLHASPLSGGEGVTESAGLAEALTLAREALIAANPEAVAELITGATAAELRASVAAAKAAYASAAERVRQQLGEQSVPAGGGARSEQGAVDVAALSPSAKISTAIERRNARG